MNLLSSDRFFYSFIILQNHQRAPGAVSKSPLQNISFLNRLSQNFFNRRALYKFNNLFLIKFFSGKKKSVIANSNFNIAMSKPRGRIRIRPRQNIINSPPIHRVKNKKLFFFFELLNKKSFAARYFYKIVLLLKIIINLFGNF